MLAGVAVPAGLVENSAVALVLVALAAPAVVLLPEHLATAIPLRVCLMVLVGRAVQAGEAAPAAVLGGRVDLGLPRSH
jgi:hypothetical protein